MDEQRERQAQKAADHAKHYGTDFVGALARIIESMKAATPPIEGGCRCRPLTPSLKKYYAKSVARRRAKSKVAKASRRRNRKVRHKAVVRG
jgi:hypothetical protein